MKLVCSWLKLTAIATTLAAIQTIGINPVAANTAIRLDPIDPIDIYVPPPESNRTGVCSSFIKPIVDRIVDTYSFGSGKWGILVQSLDGTTVYSHNPDSYLIPASNNKILVTAAALQKLTPTSQIHSKSLREWITVTNLRSNNYYADTLFSYLGGFTSIRQALDTLGIDSKGYRLHDGSGLSRNNLVTPRTLVTTLRAMHSAPGNEVFMASLPVAGISGTLKHRLQHTSAEGTVHAKTGTLKGVRALSGYIEHPEYGTLVFSIISNQPTSLSNSTLLAGIDRIVLSLSTLTNCD
jgi:D-alanyl-D-alanine carboxypeptidase/D-alanyl-D-alanine-endopeptidase (penicillin-binding protein 4)